MRTHIVPSRAATARQRGAGMAGFLLTALPVLLLGAGGIETAHWLFLRQSLGFALVEAGRAAITRQAEPAALAQAFERALRILHPQPPQLEAALAWRRHALDGLPWRIRIVRPARAAFLDHADADLGARGAPARLATIRNDRQDEQYRRDRAKGWPEGRGPTSGDTIFEANTLALELTWPHRPLLPGVAAVLRLMARPSAPSDYRQRVLAQGLLPIMRSTMLAMHSHPARWPDLADGRVVHEGSAPTGAAHASGCRAGAPACLPIHNEAGPVPGVPGPGLAPATGADSLDSGTPADKKAGAGDQPPSAAKDADGAPPGEGLTCDPPST
ncbi:hypothetical protein [Castellaniella sp. GW247-6E4]|uniref:hypothetical protein n=1 Tax=Castellaniella sp. GW247-6E4 TaxID=3140380 RepID=UPI003315111A